MAVYPKPRLSLNPLAHQRFPYLLKGVAIVRPNQVWSTDITYIRLRGGFVFLAAILDWAQPLRSGLGTVDHVGSRFLCGRPRASVSRPAPRDFQHRPGRAIYQRSVPGTIAGGPVRLSMDGRGRAFDNIFVERLWRSVSYEEVYLKDYRNVSEAREGLRQYFPFYNQKRIHQALDYRTPHSVHFDAREPGNQTNL